MKNKRALSTVVVTLILVLLAVVVAGIVWAVVDNIVKEETDYSESCFGIFEKVMINNDYTCYDEAKKEFSFGIGMSEIEVDELKISITWPGEFQSIILPGSFDYLRYYDGNYGDRVDIPKENSGKTYVLNVTELGLDMPESIEIAPVVNGHQCEVSDSLQGIIACSF